MVRARTVLSFEFVAVAFASIALVFAIGEPASAASKKQCKKLHGKKKKRCNKRRQQGGQQAPLPAPPSPTNFGTASQSLTPAGQTPAQNLSPAYPPPIGFPIRTIQPTGKPQGITIGDELFPADSPSAKQCPIAGGQQSVWIQILVLDRTKLSCKRQYAFGRMDKKTSPLTDAIKGTQANEIVVITGGSRNQPSPDTSEERDALSDVYRMLGGTWRPFFAKQKNGARGFRYGDWSLIGSRSDDGDAPEGTAMQAQGFENSDAPQPSRGALEGFMQVNREGFFSFASPHYSHFDTDVPKAPAGTNTIKVGDATYPSTAGGQPALAASEAGFQLLVLDQGTLSPILNKTFVTNKGKDQDTKGDDSLTALTKALNDRVLDPEVPALVMLQSIGKPSGRTSAWTGDFASALRDVGGTKNVLNLLDGSSGYTLVGGTRLPVNSTDDKKLNLGDSGFGEEAVPQHTPGITARLTGILSHNRQSQYFAGNASPSDEFDLSVYEVVYGDKHQPWKYSPADTSSTPGQRAALSYMTNELNRKAALKDPNYLRANYVLNSSAVEWANYKTSLANIAYPTTTGPGFSEDEFKAVKGQLDTEFGYVSDLRAMIDDYQLVYTNESTAGLVDLKKITDDISKSIDPPPQAGTTIDMQDIATGILTWATGAAGAVPVFGPLVGGAMGELTGISTIAAAFQTRNGVPISAEIEAKGSELGQKLIDSYAIQQDALDQVGDIMVSDWGRLRGAGPKATSAWAFGTDGKRAATTALTATAKIEAYSALMPLAYNVYALRLPPDGKSAGISAANKYKCFQAFPPNDPAVDAFPNAKSNTQYLGVDTWVSGKVKKSPHLLVNITKKDLFDYASVKLSEGYEARALYPSDGILEAMFDPLAKGGELGLDRPTFFEQQFGYHQIQCDTYGERGKIT